MHTKVWGDESSQPMVQRKRYCDKVLIMYEYSIDGIACILTHSSPPKEVLSNWFYQRQESPWHLERNISSRGLLLWANFLPDLPAGLLLRAIQLILQNSQGGFLVLPKAFALWPGSREGWKIPTLHIHIIFNSKKWLYSNFCRISPNRRKNNLQGNSNTEMVW